MFVQQTRRIPAPLALTLAAVVGIATSCQSTEATESPVDADTGATAVSIAATEISVAPTQDPEPQGSLAAQRAQFLSKKHVADAKRLQLDGRLEEAKLLLLRAKELTPSNANVLSTLASVQAQLGEPAGEARTYGQQMARLWKIREERAKADVADRLQAGRQAMAAERFEEAMGYFRGVVTRIRAGSDIEWGNLEDQARGMLTDAENQRDFHETAKQAAVERDILRQRRDQEEAEQARRQARVDGYIETAIRAFDRSRFKLSQDLALQAMELDATSHLARDIHNASTKALGDSRSDSYVRDKRNAYIKFLEAAEDLRIPQTDILRTDPVIWEIAAKRKARTGPATTDDPENVAVRQQIASKTVPPITFVEETGEYEDVIRLVRTVTDIPIILTPEARAVIADESLFMEVEIAAPLAVSHFLDLMTEKSENLAWTVRNGVVEMTSRVASGGDNILSSHDVRDLVFARTEFLPPIIRDLPSGESFGEGGPRTGGEGDEKIAYIEPDALQQNIKGSTGGETYWDAEGGGTMEFVDSGYLLVFANPEMQARVERFLADQRRFATSVVSIETKFLTVTQNFLQEIGVDFRGLGGSGNKGSVVQLDDITNALDDNASRGLDNQGTGDDAGHPSAGAFFNDGGDGDIRGRTENFFGSSLGQALTPGGGATAAITILDDLQLQLLVRAVEKQEEVQAVNGQILTVLNNERANIAVLNQTSYVRDFDVEVAQASFIADPKVDVIQDGIVLDVRPTIAHDRKHVMLSLNPTVAVLERPIPTFTTSLAGATLPVTLQLPTLTVRSFATTASVPDGGSVLIGGLRQVLEKERTAKSSIFGDLPLLGFLFKQEGVVDENESLAVLVTATITDVQDLLRAR